MKRVISYNFITVLLTNEQNPGDIHCSPFKAEAPWCRG